MAGSEPAKNVRPDKEGEAEERRLIETAVDRAYAEKYKTPGSRHFVEGFKEKNRRDTTTELVPL